MKKLSIPDNLIDGLTQIDEEIWNVNSGGCGVVAYAIVKKLHQEGHLAMDDDWAICFLHGFDAHNFKHNRLALKPRSKKVPGSCNHVVVRVGNVWVDSGGVYTDNRCVMAYDDEYVVETKSPTKLLLALNHASWNPCFDRYEDMKRIAEILNVDLSEIYEEWDVKERV